MDGTKQDSILLLKKLSFSLLTLVLIGAIFSLGKNIILPLMFAILLATLLLPVVNYLQQKKFPVFLSIILPLIVSLLTILGVLYFLSTQIAHFFDDWETLKERVDELLNTVQRWVAQNFNVAAREQEEYINETTEKVKTEAPKIAGRTFLSLTGSFSYLILLPIYTFLTLYYKNTIKHFFLALFNKSDQNKVVETLHACSHVSQRYISGLLIETSIVFSLNTLGFVILGIQYAVFLALLAALLNLIPYIGMLIANIFCMLITLLTSENPTDALWVAGILAVVQFFDNNIGMPLIVGNNVRINALATIVGVLVGGALCGVPGMFLAIPGLAVLKVVFDRVEDLHPWGILIGDETPVRGELKTPRFLKRKRKDAGEK
jgi:predicted PurR-regulated permease PerM